MSTTLLNILLAIITGIVSPFAWVTARDLKGCHVSEDIFNVSGIYELEIFTNECIL